MEELVDEDPGELRGGAVERNPALPKECAGVNLAVSVAKARGAANSHRFAGDRRQAPHYCL